MNKQTLVEMIRRRISGGDPHDFDNVRDAEIMVQIEAAANRLLRASHIATLAEGETIPSGSIIATYENIAVTQGSRLRAVATLPVTPMDIQPNNQGVFAVYPSGYPELEFIPVPSGTIEIIKRDKLVSNIHRKLYSYNSGKVYIEDDLVGAGVLLLDMKLCVMEISQHGLTDPLPITPELAEQIMLEVVAFYNPQMATK